MSALVNEWTDLAAGKALVAGPGPARSFITNRGEIAADPIGPSASSLTLGKPGTVVLIDLWDE